MKHDRGFTPPSGHEQWLRILARLIAQRILAERRAESGVPPDAGTAPSEDKGSSPRRPSDGSSTDREAWLDEEADG